MAIRRNNFEGGTASTGITTGNSGGASGDAFNAVTTTGAGASAQYSDAHARGSLAARLATGTGAGVSFLEWNSLGFGTSIYERAYAYLEDLPTTNVIAMRAAPSTGVIGGVRVNTDGTLSLCDSGNTARATSSSTVPTDAWFRVEALFVSHATAGQITCRIVTDPDSDTAAEEFATTAAWNTNGGNAAICRFGPLNPNTTSQVIWFDDVATSDEGWIGPSVASPLAIAAPPAAIVRASAW